MITVQVRLQIPAISFNKSTARLESVSKDRASERNFWGASVGDGKGDLMTSSEKLMRSPRDHIWWQKYIKTYETHSKECTSARCPSTYFSHISHQPNPGGSPTVNGASTYRSWLAWLIEVEISEKKHRKGKKRWEKQGKSFFHCCWWPISAQQDRVEKHMGRHAVCFHTTWSGYMQHIVRELESGVTIQSDQEGILDLKVFFSW